MTNEFIPGVFKWRTSKDKYNNDVTIIAVPNHAYRMVHHTPAEPELQKATIYAGPGKFVRYRMFQPDNDCKPTELTIGGYTGRWGDGDPLGVTIREGWPDISDKLRGYYESQMEEFILTILTEVDRRGLWEQKAVAAAGSST